MNVLDRFTAANVPAMGPDEEFSPSGNPNAIAPDKKVLWRYDCNNSKGAEHPEVHACQPIGLDKVML